MGMPAGRPAAAAPAVAAGTVGDVPPGGPQGCESLYRRLGAEGPAASRAPPRERAPAAGIGGKGWGRVPSPSSRAEAVATPPRSAAILCCRRLLGGAGGVGGCEVEELGGPQPCSRSDCAAPHHQHNYYNFFMFYRALGQRGASPPSLPIQWVGGGVGFVIHLRLLGGKLPAVLLFSVESPPPFQKEPKTCEERPANIFQFACSEAGSVVGVKNWRG